MMACVSASSSFHPYTFCVLDELQTALKRRDVFVTQSWRYADPRVGLLDGAEWEATQQIICRTLGLTADSTPTVNALSDELDGADHAVQQDCRTIRQSASKRSETSAN
jgi:hypothetical protein